MTVNGVDMSRDIRNSAIAVHTRVIDEGEIIIKPKDRAIIITAPPGMSQIRRQYPSNLKIILFTTKFLTNLNFQYLLMMKKFKKR